MTNDTISAAPDPVSRGDDLVIDFADESRAHQTVTVEITDGTQTESVQIELNGAGIGSTTWGVPAGWGPAALLTEPGSTDVSVVVA